MSNLFKSKFFLGVLVVAVMLVGVVAFAPTADAVDCTITSTLRVGSRGADVQCLQSSLGLTADGVFGPMTKAGVEAFQASNSLVADGIFGPASRAAWTGTASTTTPSACSLTSTLRVGSRGADVQCLQAGLGLTADGVFGPATKAGVIAYQASKGLVADGIFGPASRAAWTGTVVTVPSGSLCPNGMTLASNCSVAPTVTTPVVNPTGPVTAVLATDNPAAGTVVVAQAGADLAHFMFTGSGTVTNVTLKRIGVSSDSTLARVYLYDGAIRLTDAASITNNSTITFNNPNGLFVVNGSKTISVKADLGIATTGALSGETVGIALAGYTALGQTAATLGTAITGNYMTVSTATLATVGFGAITPGANSTLTPEADVTVWKSTVTVSTRDVWLTRFAIREVGSIAKTDLTNLRLMVGATTVATVANPDANGYATFVPTSPMKLTTGAHTFKVIVDVTGGSSLNFTFSIRNTTDIGLVDSQYNVGLLTSTSIGSLAGSLQTVSTGSVTVQKATNSPTSTVVLSGTDVVLARYTAKTYGENVKVDTLTVDATLSTAGSPTLRNGRILVDGQQIGSTTTIDPLADTTATDAGTAFNVNHTFLAGTTSIIEVRADVYNNATGGTAMAAGDTVLITLYGSSGLNNAQGVVSGSAVLDVPGANVAANTLTVGSGSMTLAKDQAYGNQSVVVPTTNTLLSSWTLTSGATEALNLDTIQVDFTASVDDFTAVDLSNVYIMYGSRSTSVKSTVSVTAAANTWNITELIPVNSSMTFKVYGDIASGAVVSASTDSMNPSLLVSGTSASGTAVNTNGNLVLLGQVITAVSTGVLTVSLDTNTPVASQVVAGATDSAGSLKLKVAGTNEANYIKSLTVYVDTSADSAAIASMNLAWASTSNGSYVTVGNDQSITYDVSTYPGYVTWTLTGSGRVTVPKDGSVYLKVTPTYVSSGQTSVSSLTPQLFLGDLQAEGTAVLVAGGVATLVNTTGIIVQANTSATYIDSTETIDTAIALATTRTISMTAAEAFVAGDVIFIDTYASDCTTKTPDNLWSGTCEELMVVLDNGVSATDDLTVVRGAFGTTAQAVIDTGTSIYLLGGLVAETNGVIGSEMTVLNTKLGITLKSNSPSGATNGETAKYVLGFNVTAANNSADTAANTATLTYVDITASKSSLASANVSSMVLYPDTDDLNATYVTTCVGLSTTKWRCTLSTAGSKNQIDENSSRGYVVRADVGFTSNGNVKFSLASLGTSSTTPNLTTGNSVAWSDGLTSSTTAQYWVNQATTILNGGQLSSVLASGTTETDVPTITALAVTNVGSVLDMDIGDTIKITFSEMIDPSIINTGLIPGVSAASSLATDIANTATGGLACTSTGSGTIATCTIAGIATFIDTYSTGTGYTALTPSTVTLSLDSTGVELTVTIKTVTGGDGGTGTQTLTATTAIVGTSTVGIRDMQGNVLAAGSAGITATGSF